MIKDKSWLLEKHRECIQSPKTGEKLLDEGYELALNDMLIYINQLDEPEVLSQKWIDEHRKSYTMEDSVEISDLQNLLVPKQKEVDRAYKDGYEKGKEHTFYKGYLEGITDKGSEPETVAHVVTTFWKSYERLKEVMSMEVEELEE